MPKKIPFENPVPNDEHADNLIPFFTFLIVLHDYLSSSNDIDWGFCFTEFYSQKRAINALPLNLRVSEKPLLETSLH
jgi:hypothetical protein